MSQSWGRPSLWPNSLEHRPPDPCRRRWSALWLTVIAVTCLSLLPVPLQAETRPAFRYPGVYAVAPRHLPVPDLVLQSTAVMGVSLREDWGHLEATEGHFVWDFLDGEFERAARAGKRVTLRVYPGVRTPDWVYAAGAERFTYRSVNPGLGREKPYGQLLTFPVPWSTVLFAKWTKLISAIGKRYGKEDRLAIVHVMGPNARGAEMRLPREPDDLAQWERLGYTPEKLTEAWKRTIDLYATAFPKAYLSLNLSYPVIRKGETVVDDIVKYAFTTYQTRIVLQNNSLRDPEKARLKRHDFEIIRAYASKTAVGFQMYDIGSPVLNRGKQGDLKRSIEYALSVGARYIEVFPPDIRDLPAVIEDAARRLREPR